MREERGRGERGRIGKGGVEGERRGRGSTVEDTGSGLVGTSFGISGSFQTPGA